MAYLPPAGKRDFTEYKLTYLPTMSEIRNPGYTDRMLARAKRPKHVLFTADQLPPSKVKAEDWIFKPPPKYPSFEDFGSPQHPFCLGLPYKVTKLPDTEMHCQTATLDPKELPYGLPPISSSVKRRRDWLVDWKEENYKYYGAYQLWEQKYGLKYCYRCPSRCEDED